MGYGVIILAAGNGKRMQSEIPKVLHNCAGKPMLCHVLITALKLPAVQKVVVVAGKHLNKLQEVCEKFIVADQINNSATHPEGVATRILWAFQEKQLGTADAVAVGLKELVADRSITNILILSADVPLISVATLSKFITNTKPKSIGLITANVKEPSGLGRIIKDRANNLLKIVEDADANDLEKQITEINTGMYLFPKDFLSTFLPKINNKNSQEEYYLPDIFKFAIDQGVLVHIENVVDADIWEVMGINTRLQLVELDREFQVQQAKKFLAQGVTIIDPQRFDLRGEAEIAKDVEIDVNVILIGKVIIGSGTKIGPNCYIKDTIIGSNVTVAPYSMIDGATLHDNVTIGPFARIRPDTTVKSGAKIGNFVEVKASTINEYSKINHLSYIGNAKIGNNVNVGAGTITCNYDGINKHITVIDDGAFIGSGCQLIAPVTVHKQAFIASGTTLTKDAPPGKLTLNKKDQQSKEWQRPKKQLPEEQIP